MDLLATTSTVAVSCYALLSTVYKSLQALYATRPNAPAPPGDLTHTSAALPSVDVIVPCFNEDPHTLAACLQSISAQDYAGELRVYVIDDGSANRALLEPVHSIFATDARFSFILLESNVGKRKAQITAIRRSIGDLVLNVDSDTMIATDVVTKLALKMQSPEVGAAMGQLTASNRSDTWLTRLIDMEYWLACNEERAAQARFGAVMCCCGPCAMYRRSALVLLLDQYESQFFRGRPSDFGEDRHLTILMLKAGFRTEYVPDAVAATVVPEKLGPYLRQQLRWARSTFRDTFLGLRLLRDLDSYLTLDVVGQNIGPLLLALSSIMAVAQLAVTATVPWWTIITIASMTMVRCGVAAFRARQLRFFGFSLHTPINIALLLPVKAYALCTLSNSDWLSRKVANVPAGNEKQAVVQNPSGRRSAAEGAQLPRAVRRTDLSCSAGRLAATDNVCGGE
ncbi:chitooligosaccharide synthase NodC [Bradyrhizobium yuanmingense]|uniref:chitooligosaccharide synthase NodC n=1 Tax=Bradyrhizobium yuanmingense TaxID=108015 RepID=UPI0012FBAEE3|nr:chitooligosaccharide synthase NodC [Bradyrhizobium yuanmingense]MDF0492888.1 chitooligosaccharide synthase NodC [Bradyrhizobium yuanmingense]MVT54195.1 chitooligosaccharide synthase NodC [Bradyrhizobium yuanmingense]